MLQLQQQQTIKSTIFFLSFFQFFISQLNQKHKHLCLFVVTFNAFFLSQDAKVLALIKHIHTFLIIMKHTNLSIKRFPNNICSRALCLLLYIFFRSRHLTITKQF